MTRDNSGALLSIVFAPGQRPTLAALQAWQPTAPIMGFAVTHSAQDGDTAWAELLASGLAFDCHGLGDGASVQRPAARHRLGIEALPLGEALAISPGPHIAGGANLPPVVRALVGLGAEFARMPGVEALCWGPAECCMAPDYFRRIAEDWLAGGPFPALGLTMLNRLPSGAIESQGLDFFVGQEICLDGDGTLSTDRMAQLVIRLINELVARGALAGAHDFAFDGFPPVHAEPSADGTLLKVAMSVDAR